jgi:hypothetical protein
MTSIGATRRLALTQVKLGRRRGSKLLLRFIVFDSPLMRSRLRPADARALALCQVGAAGASALTNIKATKANGVTLPESERHFTSESCHVQTHPRSRRRQCHVFQGPRRGHPACPNMKHVAAQMFAAVLVLCGCASPTGKPTAGDHAAHHPTAAASAVSAAGNADQPMRMMQAMREKMQGAKTPQERDALMEEHMKAMSMMCGMGAQDGAGVTPPAIK